MNTEQAQQIAQAMETAVTKNIVDAINKQSNNKNIYSNNVLIIIALFAAILGMGVWANSKLNQVIASSNDTASAVVLGLDGVSSQISEVSDTQASIHERLDGIQTSVDKIPTKPVVIVERPKPSFKDYEACVEWTLGLKLPQSEQNKGMKFCRMYRNGK